MAHNDIAKLIATYGHSFRYHFDAGYRFTLLYQRRDGAIMYRDRVHTIKDAMKSVKKMHKQIRRLKVKWILLDNVTLKVV